MRGEGALHGGASDCYPLIRRITPRGILTLDSMRRGGFFGVFFGRVHVGDVTKGLLDLPGRRVPARDVTSGGRKIVAPGGCLGLCPFGHLLSLWVLYEGFQVSVGF